MQVNLASGAGPGRPGGGPGRIWEDTCGHRFQVARVASNLLGIDQVLGSIFGELGCQWGQFLFIFGLNIVLGVICHAHGPESWRIGFSLANIVWISRGLLLLVNLFPVPDPYGNLSRWGGIWRGMCRERFIC